MSVVLGGNKRVWTANSLNDRLLLYSARIAIGWRWPCENECHVSVVSCEIHCSGWVDRTGDIKSFDKCVQFDGVNVRHSVAMWFHPICGRYSLLLMLSRHGIRERVRKERESAVRVLKIPWNMPSVMTCRRNHASDWQSIKHCWKTTESNLLNAITVVPQNPPSHVEKGAFGRERQEWNGMWLINYKLYSVPQKMWHTFCTP